MGKSVTNKSLRSIYEESECSPEINSILEKSCLDKFQLEYPEMFGAKSLGKDEEILFPTFTPKFSLNGVAKLSSPDKIEYKGKGGGFWLCGSITGVKEVYVCLDPLDAISIYLNRRVPVLCFFDSGAVLDTLTSFQKKNERIKLTFISTNSLEQNLGSLLTSNLCAKVLDTKGRTPKEMIKNGMELSTFFSDAASITEAVSEVVNENSFIYDDRGKLKITYLNIVKYIINKYKLRSVDGVLFYYCLEDNFYKKCHNEWVEQRARAIIPMSHLFSSGEIKEIRLRIDQDPNIVEGGGFFDIYNKINFRNCYVEVKNDEIKRHEHTHKVGFLNALPYDYKETENEPERLSACLDSYFNGDQKIKRCIYEYIGYILSGDECDMDKCLLLFGEGKNGKSTLVDIIKGVVGNRNVFDSNIISLEKEYNLYELHGKLMMYSEETNSNSFLKCSDIFKKLVTGGRITGRRLYHDPITFKSRTKLILDCNKIPPNKDNTFGFYRRFMMVPFKNEIASDKTIKRSEVVKKCLEEANEIINYSLNLYFKAKNRGEFSESPSVVEVLDQYKESNDSVLFYINENNIKNVPFIKPDQIDKAHAEGADMSLFKISESVPYGNLDKIYSNYKTFCRNHGYNLVTFSNFNTRFCSHLKADYRRRRVAGQRGQWAEGVFPVYDP